MKAVKIAVEVAVGPDFRRALQIALKFTGRGYDPRQFLSAVLVTPGYVTATDSHVLVRVPWVCESVKFDPFIVDPADVKAIIRLLPARGMVDAFISIDGQQASVSCGGRGITFPLLDCEYPDALVDGLLAKPVLADGEHPAPTISFNPALLARFSVLSTSAAWPIQVSFPADPLHPVRVEHLETGAVGLIMPVRGAL